MNIIAWGDVVPWAEQRQVEQHLIISRVISDLRETFRFPLSRDNFHQVFRDYYFRFAVSRKGFYLFRQIFSVH